MKQFIKLSMIGVLAVILAQSKANAKQGKCEYNMPNPIVAAVKTGDNHGDVIIFNVYGTGDVTYIHKDGTNSTGIVNLDPGTTVVVHVSDPVPWHDTAREKAEKLLYEKAKSKLMEQCNAMGCNKNK